jgi:membrane protein DedA with SNARE-associated domain
MDLGELIARYGYAAVFLGTLAEGETVVLLAGFAAQRGHLDVWLVAACAFAGSLLSDQMYFFVGRRHGTAWLARRPRWQQRLARIRSLTDSHQIKLTLSFRFIYGFRTVTPFALGLSSIPAARFALLNIMSAAVWSVAVAGLGYTLGNAVEPLIADIERYETALFVAFAIVGVLVWLLRRRKARTTPVAL